MVKTTIKITDKTVGETREYQHTDRFSIYALIDSLTSYVEYGSFEEGHHIVIEVEDKFE